MKIRSYLVALILSLFVPFTIFAGAIAYTLAERERAASVDGLRSTARALAIAVDRNVADISNSLTVLAEAELLRIGELRGFHRYAGRVADSRPELRRLLLVDSDGTLLFDSGLAFAATPTATIRSPQLARAVGSGLPSIGRTIEGYGDPDPSAIFVFVPAVRASNLNYVLIGVLNLSAIGEIFADQKLPGDWTGVVLDEDGTILGRSRSPELFVGRTAPEALVAAISGRREGVAEYATQEGWPTLAGFARSTLTGWSVVLGMPATAANIAAGRILTIMLAIGAAVSLTALAIAAFLGHRISRPVLGLLEPATAIARGATIATAGKTGISEIQRVMDGLKTASDILAEREAQRQRAEERYRLASLAANDFIWEHDIQTRRTIRSANFAAAFGYATDEPVGTGRWWRDHLHPDDAPRVLASVEEFLASDRSVWSSEYRLRKGDGTYAYILDRAYCVRDEHGRPVRAVGAKVDVTARRLVEEQLRKSEAHLARAQRVAEIGSWELMLETGEFYWSDETFRILGQSRDSSAPTLHAVTTMFVEEDLPAILRPVEMARAGWVPAPADISLDFRLRRADGTIRILRREGEAVVDAAGKLVSLIGTIRDVTEIRAAESHRRELEAQLRQTQKMETLGQLTGGIAHDFNNLLAVLVGNLELAVRKQRKGALATELDEASLRAASRGAALTRQLLTFARRQPLRPVRHDLRQLVEAMAPILEPALTARIALVFELAAAPCWVEIDSGQFEAALLNLALNARDAMPQGGTLTIRVRHVQEEPRGRVEVAVQDTGTGMSAEVRARAFEPFFTTKEVGKGSGLGLAMVYGFVRQSGGRVDIDSAPGKGTCVTLSFAASDAAQAAVVAGEPGNVRFHDLRVLLVEDDPEVRETVREMLGDLGATALVARDGQAAIAALKADASIDILLTDILMPGMDGITVARVAGALRPGTRIVFMSGHAELDQRALQAIDGRPFLVKPFRKLDLAAALSEARRPGETGRMAAGA